MYAFLGWLNVALLTVMTAPYWLHFFNKHLLHLQGGMYAKAIKPLRTIHKPLGAAILIIAAIHGYLALGALRLHTGSLLWASLFVTAILGGTFFLTRKKALFVWHKRLVLLALALLLLHLLYPSAVYYLLH